MKKDCAIIVSIIALMIVTLLIFKNIVTTFQISNPYELKSVSIIVTALVKVFEYLIVISAISYCVKRLLYT